MKIKLRDSRDNNDGNATMLGLLREGVEVEIGAAVAVAATVAMAVADNNRNGEGKQQ